MKTEDAYTGWPLLPELFPTSYPGVKTSRDEGLVDIDRDALVKRMEAYFDTKVSHEQMRQIAPKLMTDAARFIPLETRETLQDRGLLPGNFVRFVYRPFDVRWLYWEPLTKLLDEKRPDYFPHVFSGNVWLTACQQNRKEFDPPIVCQPLAAIHIIERTANLFPMLLKDVEQRALQYVDQAARQVGHAFANLSNEALAYLNRFDGVADAPHLFHHVVAVLHAPRYAEQNASALRQDWPRIPLPATRTALLASADLGRKVATLLDPETPVDGVTAGRLSPAMRGIGEPTRVGGGQLTGSDLDVTARWGITGKAGVTMPSTGKVNDRAFTDEEKATLGDAGVRLLGPDTCDVYLNDTAYWRNVPRRVWEYRLGGYQVLKKWLSYREQTILGRGLTIAEVAHVRDTARRMAALLLIGPDLDTNYAAVTADPAPWPPTPDDRSG